MNTPDGALASGLSYADLDRFASLFGVAEQQIRRDHLISHLLAAIAASDVHDQVTFFGGTALTRTVLPNLRLSEDIDLIATGPMSRSNVANGLQNAFNRAVARTHGRLLWEPNLRMTASPNPAVVATSDGLAVQVQLLSPIGYPAWPTSVVSLERRYADVPKASLKVLTVEAFVAAKTAAWASRHAPRDLFDLWALARDKKITPSAAQVYRALGPTGNNPPPQMFDVGPPDTEWQAALGHQCRLTIGADEACFVVAEAWADATLG